MKVDLNCQLGEEFLIGVSSGSGSPGKHGHTCRQCGTVVATVGRCLPQEDGNLASRTPSVVIEIRLGIATSSTDLLAKTVYPQSG